MDRAFAFTKEEEKLISEHFGVDFLHRAVDKIIKAIDLWGLCELSLVPSFSANLVLSCNASSYGRSIMKISNNPEEFIYEVTVLAEWEGSKVCQLYAHDVDEGILLEEAIEPGKTLRQHPSMDERLTLFLQLYKGFHKVAANSNQYPTYGSWVNNMAVYMSQQKAHHGLYRKMKKAKGLYDQLTQTYDRKRLLHGDFHHDNILLDKDGSYRVIDPKGVIGDPIFDLPRYILNEFLFAEKTDVLYEEVCKMIGSMSQQLDLPVKVIQQCTYIETIMGSCWCVEDGISLEELPELMKTVDFAKRILEADLEQMTKHSVTHVERRWMAEAIEDGHRAGDLLEVPIGAVIVYEGKVIGRGYNQRNTMKSTLGHAEIIAIEQASAAMDDWRLEGCTMYVTVEPCPMCAGAIVQARMDRVVIGTMNTKAGCAGSIYNLLQDERFNHQVEIVYGVMEDECSAMMSDFFRNLRAQKKLAKKK